MREFVTWLAEVAVMGVGPEAWAQGRAWEGWGGHPMMWGTGGAWNIGMLLFMVLVWGLLIVAVVMGIRWLTKDSREGRSDGALDILRRRYAGGEIDRNEFEAKKQDLA